MNNFMDMQALRKDLLKENSRIMGVVWFMAVLLAVSLLVSQTYGIHFSWRVIGLVVYGCIFFAIAASLMRFLLNGFHHGFLSDKNEERGLDVIAVLFAGIIFSVPIILGIGLSELCVWLSIISH